MRKLKLLHLMQEKEREEEIFRSKSTGGRSTPAQR